MDFSSVYFGMSTLVYFWLIFSQSFWQHFIVVTYDIARHTKQFNLKRIAIRKLIGGHTQHWQLLYQFIPWYAKYLNDKIMKNMLFKTICIIQPSFISNIFNVYVYGGLIYLTCK